MSAQLETRPRGTLEGTDLLPFEMRRPLRYIITDTQYTLKNVG